MLNIREICCFHSLPHSRIRADGFRSTFIQIINLRYSSSARKNYYQILGVQPATDPKEIKERFYKLSKQYHPDLNKDDPNAMSKFKELVEAYETLSNLQEKSKYDGQHGFTPEQKIDIRKGKMTRNFHRGGLNEKGQFVDFDEPPVMRNIEYDLSPEKMQRIWERYKTRWEKIEEVERIRELEKKKIEFRKKLDERRANMKNMSPEEIADLRFKLRMLRTDIDFDAANVAGSSKNNIRDLDKATSKTKKDRPIHTSSSTKENVNNFNKENVKTGLNINENVSDNYDYREEINRIKEENKQYKEDKFDFGSFSQRDLGREQEKMEEEEMFRFQGKSYSDNWNPREDPFLKGMNRNDPSSFKDWASKSYESSKETLHEMNRSKNPTSVKHDINTQWEKRVTKRIFLVGIVSVISMLFLNSIDDSGFDKVHDDKVEKAHNK